jgi:hypothetical protein
LTPLALIRPLDDFPPPVLLWDASHQTVGLDVSMAEPKEMAASMDDLRGQMDESTDDLKDPMAEQTDDSSMENDRLRDATCHHRRHDRHLRLGRLHLHRHDRGP